MAYRVFEVINHDGGDDVEVTVTKRIETLEEAIKVAKNNPNCGKTSFFGKPIVTIRTNNGRKIIKAF